MVALTGDYTEVCLPSALKHPRYADEWKAFALTVGKIVLDELEKKKLPVVVRWAEEDDDGRQ